MQNKRAAWNDESAEIVVVATAGRRERKAGLLYNIWVLNPPEPIIGVRLFSSLLVNYCPTVSPCLLLPPSLPTPASALNASLCRRGKNHRVRFVLH
jgi:hypothetical protein